MGKRGPVKGEEIVLEKQTPRRKLVLDEKTRRLIADPLPLEPPIGYKRTPPLAEQIRAMVRGEALAHAARNSGKETFEEADDFDVDDDFDPQAPYEEVFEPPATWEDQAQLLGEKMEEGRQRYAAKVEEERKKKERKREKRKAKSVKEDNEEASAEGEAKEDGEG